MNVLLTLYKMVDLVVVLCMDHGHQYMVLEY